MARHRDKTRKPAKAPAKPASAVVKPSRKIPEKTQLALWVKAGGRCEFDGCNAYLLEHHVTKKGGKFGELAHIVAFNDGGPRAKPKRAGGDIHDASNLMLLCPTCHKLIDDRPLEFTVAVLRKHKAAHEARVFLLTGTSPDRKTVAVLLRGKVAGKPVTITLSQIQAAVAPRYVGDRGVHDIDLTALDDTTAPEFWKIAAETIRARMKGFYGLPFDGHEPEHLSVLALAPIPLLMVLGTTLSDKVETSLFQRHRDSESWLWKKTGVPVDFTTTQIQRGTDPNLVALVVSVSGVIARTDLPAHIDARYSIFALSPVGIPPDRAILAVEASLQSFRGEYQRAMRLLVQEHPAAKSVDVFPAVPAPAAVAMGRDLLPKRDPVLVIYDFNKAAGGFVPALEINQP